MTSLPVLRSMAAGAALVLAGCAASEPPREAAAPAEAGQTAVSPEAAALIAEGDAAKAEADALRAEAAALDRTLAGENGKNGENATSGDGTLAWAGATTRGTGTAATDPAELADPETLTARRDAALTRAEALDQKAVEAWEGAVALDANAQQQIMERLLGSVPES